MFLLGILRCRGISLIRPCSSAASTASYKSPIAVESLYPSRPQFLDRYSTPSPPISSDSTFTGWIPMDSLTWNQEPNSTKVSISFDPKQAEWLPKEASLTPGRNGLITVSSNRTRCYLLNRADVLQKLRAVIRESIFPSNPRPILEKEIEVKRKASMKVAREKLIIPSSQSSIFPEEANIISF